jgi:hypothetical protein
MKGYNHHSTNSKDHTAHTSWTPSLLSPYSLSPNVLAVTAKEKKTVVVGVISRVSKRVDSDISPGDFFRIVPFSPLWAGARRVGVHLLAVHGWFSLQQQYL